MNVLRHDTVTRDTQVPCVDANGNPNPNCARLVPAANDPTGTQLGPLVRNAMIRPDKRPRPISLRVNAGQCLQITYENSVAPQVVEVIMPNAPLNPYPGAVDTINPFAVIPALANNKGFVVRDDQFVTRANSIHVNVMQLVNNIEDYGSYVGRNANSLVCPTGGACPDGALPGPRTYKLYAEFENVYFLRDMANTFGGEGGGGTVTLGLCGAFMVEPAGAQYFRSNSTNEDMVLSRIAALPGGQPQLDYDAVYPNDPAGVYAAEGKVGIPVLKMIGDAATAAIDADGPLGNLDNTTTCGPLAIGQLAHTDTDAIITGPASNGYWFVNNPDFPHYPSTAMNPRQDLPFREFGSNWNDEQSWEMRDRINLDPMFLRPPSNLEGLKSRPIAYLIEGEFSSFFAGKPLPEREAAEKKEGETAADPAAQETPEAPKMDPAGIERHVPFTAKGKPGRLFVLGSSEMLKNVVIDESGRGVNTVFALNAIDYLNNREGVAVMRAKVQQFNPLSETSSGIKTFIKSFNIVGLPVLVCLFGFGVWFRRTARKKKLTSSSM